ncbi:hypothetical protein Taro_022535 [Colocasia esculenta]|uniref:Late embryogenesis abundant protein LEA-2 subgroup domain-containing protein n=1 Tax=Colocasia esculenta TaxID=4460 RepID=A0A843V243_COLES|nr:hypothetical protein [Colocasia esculenta]
MRPRHDRSRYFAQKVEETLTGRMCRVFCSIFLSLLLIAAVILFILWLSLRPHRPRFHVTAFSVSPGPSQETANQSSVDITFEVTLRNPNANIGIFYEDAMRGSFFHRDRRIGDTAELLPPFYQGPKNTTIIHGAFPGSPALAVGGDVWQQMKAEAASHGQVWFRLELVVTIRFRVSTWDTHRHSMHADCDVGVAPDGSMLDETKARRCSLYFS